MAATETGLVRFVDTAKRYRMLEPEEERTLARAWQKNGDKRALERLVGSHLRLVLRIARGYRGYGLPLADLVAEGNVGLVQAAHKFDPGRGFRFATYALWWIKAAIQEYVLHSWSLVKTGTTGAQKKLFFNLRRLRAQLDYSGGGELSRSSIRAIAETLQVSEEEVVSMNQRLSGGDRSLDEPLESGEGDRLSNLADDGPSPETRLAEAEELALRRRQLRAALQVLDDRERRILFERRLNEAPSTLDALSRELRVSRERVRQIEMRALKKLQRAMLGAMPSFA